MKERLGPQCLECQGHGVLVSSKDMPDLARHDARPVWRCPCGAYVGCHNGSQRPLGRPAGPELRRARQLLHRYMDPIWLKAYPDVRNERVRAKVTKVARRRLYDFLAERMGLPEDDCHIGNLDAAQVDQAWGILRGLTYEEVRRWAHRRSEASKKPADPVEVGGP